MNSADYKRGYGKGYMTGCKRSDEARASEQARADHAAQRAERAESATSIGHCVECGYWLRGGGGPNVSVCAWGICEVGRCAGTPWATFANGQDGRPIQTTPNFGCVLFAPRLPSSAETGSCHEARSDSPEVSK